MYLDGSNFRSLKKVFDSRADHRRYIGMSQQQGFACIQTRSIDSSHERPRAAVETPEVLDRQAIISVIVTRSKSIQHFENKPLEDKQTSVDFLL